MEGLDNRTKPRKFRLKARGEEKNKAALKNAALFIGI
jgi:hypothetical protein